jgi:putative Holliday junction resolvase
MTGRILAVDPGEKRIGIAISDPTSTIAKPLSVIRHTSMILDCAGIANLASENQVIRIVVGQPWGVDGEETPQTRHSQKLADMLKSQTVIPIELWDESGSTQAARHARISMGVSRRKRSGHLDDLAAVVILQSYLDEKIEHGNG